MGSQRKHRRWCRRLDEAPGGFTLVELSMALVVISIIVGISMVGLDVYRNAIGVRIYSDFIQGWQSAHTTYLGRSGGVQPGDDPTSPTGYVNKGLNQPLCDDSAALPLSTALLQQVSLPAGRGPNRAASYVYEDKNGLPHELRVCLLTTTWAVLSTVGGAIAPVSSEKTVLRISGLTPGLARQLSSIIDGRVDAGLGSLREAQFDAVGVSRDWSVDAARDIGGSNSAELQSAELTADLLLN